MIPFFRYLLLAFNGSQHFVNLQKQLFRSISYEKVFASIGVASTLGVLGWLAHLVSRFACNTRVIVDASSNPPVSRLKLL